MNWLLAVPAGLVLLIALAVLAGRAVNGLRCRIRGKSGVQRTCYLPLGGAEQYVQIRGEDRSNPILLVLHGGLGNPMACWSFRWQRALERSYTVVHWDQRGCGNTYYRSREEARPTLELLLSDLDDLIGLLCREYGRQKVILLGHSWGTYLGARYAARHPEKVSALISVSQMVDFKGSEAASAREALTARFKIVPEAGMSGWDLLEAGGRKRGFLISGGEVDLERMANILLDEFRGGKLGRITLELPQDLEGEADHGGTP